MRKWLKWILLSLGVILLLVVLGISIFILSKSRERISFVSLNPSYKFVINKDILREVMEIGPEGQPTTWSPGGDKFAARKVWVILEPGPTSAYSTGIKRNDSRENTYTFRWVEKGDYDFLLIRVNDANWKTWTPHVQSQLLNLIALQETVNKYPTGGLSDNDISVRLGIIYLDSTRFPIEIRSRF